MKTINEAATAWANSNVYPRNKEEYGKILHRSYKKGVEFAQQWIDVNDELPENGTLCITKDAREGVFTRYSIGKYNAEHQKFQDLYNVYAKITIEPVTHWRSVELK